MVGELVEPFRYHNYIPMAGPEPHMVEPVNTCNLYFVTCLTREAPVQ
jgi:hypothetical protein